jgi:hypothetical protein
VTFTATFKYFTINSPLHVSDQVAGSDKCCCTTQHFVQYSTCWSATQTELIAALPWKQRLRERTSSVSLCEQCLSYLNGLFNDAVDCEDYTASVINV